MYHEKQSPKYDKNNILLGKSIKNKNDINSDDKSWKIYNILIIMDAFFDFIGSIRRI